jgi:hypothetical protein
LSKCAAGQRSHEQRQPCACRKLRGMACVLWDAAGLGVCRALVPCCLHPNTTSRCTSGRAAGCRCPWALQGRTSRGCWTHSRCQRCCLQSSPLALALVQRAWQQQQQQQAGQARWSSSSFAAGAAGEARQQRAVPAGNQPSAPQRSPSIHPHARCTCACVSCVHRACGLMQRDSRRRPRPQQGALAPHVWRRPGSGAGAGAARAAAAAAGHGPDGR